MRLTYVDRQVFVRNLIDLILQWVHPFYSLGCAVFPPYVCTLFQSSLIINRLHYSGTCMILLKYTSLVSIYRKS